MNTIIKALVVVPVMLWIISCKNNQSEKVDPSPVFTDLQLVWQDEFDYEGLPDAAKWSYDVGNTCDRPMGCGWGNNELQYYTRDSLKNARVENGHLIIEAHKEKISSNNYTSARLVSKGKGDFKYGRIVARAMMPSGKGTWSAIWMLPTEYKYGGWPKSGEIDIMEHVGYAADNIYGTPHTEAFNHVIGTQKSGERSLPSATTDFHDYAIEWNENRIDWYIDDTLYHTFEKESIDPAKWPFDQDFHIILNLAIGGNWGGKYGVDDTSFPNQLLVDYVRVFGGE